MYLAEKIAPDLSLKTSMLARMIASKTPRMRSIKKNRTVCVPPALDKFVKAHKDTSVCMLNNNVVYKYIK